MAGAAVNPCGQVGSTIRFDWGSDGAAAISDGVAAVVVVDVLSFTTTLSVAVDAGVEVFPYRFRDASAAAFAAGKGAVLAVGRREVTNGGVSLSPLSVQDAVRSGVLTKSGKLVLPSPNGSAISRQLSQSGAMVVGGCLRNAAAVAGWLMREVGSRPIAVIAAGERWPGEHLRPAVEDLWGAGSVISALMDAGFGSPSPEASTAAASYRSVGPTMARALSACASGRELAADGFGNEITMAAKENVSKTVPVLQGESFRAA